MAAMTRTRERPVAPAAGMTLRVSMSRAASRAPTLARSGAVSLSGEDGARSATDAQPPAFPHKYGRARFLHQRTVRGGDQDRDAEPVHFDQKAQGPLAHLGIDISCRILGPQQIGQNGR